VAIAADELVPVAEGAGARAAAGSQPEAAPWRAISRASGYARPAAARTASAARSVASSVSTPSQAAQTVTRLIWAVALGLIVLQVAAEATGQQWSFNLPATGAKLVKGSYRPLYAGQPTTIANPITAGQAAQPGGNALIGIGLHQVAGTVASLPGLIPIDAGAPIAGFFP
jgi:hypothetical protein